VKVPHRVSRRLERVARERGQTNSEIVRAALEQFWFGTQTQRPVSALELAGDFVGCVEGPGDLATNPKYMEGFER
jgi:hypothetical protein